MKKTIGTELNVLTHHLGVHSDQLDGKCVRDELFLRLHGDSHNLLNLLVGRFVHQLLEEKACKVTVHTLITRDELIREGKTGHETTLLEPENGTERTGEEDTLHGGERDETLRERSLVAIGPLKSPLSFLLDTRNGLDGSEKSILFLLVLDVRIDQKRVHLRVNVLDRDLESVEASGFGNLNFVAEILSKVLVYDTVTVFFVYFVRMNTVLSK